METGFMLLVVEELCELNLLNFLFIGLSYFGNSIMVLLNWVPSEPFNFISDRPKSGR